MGVRSNLDGLRRAKYEVVRARRVLNWPVGRRRLRQAIVDQSPPYKLHVGAGPVCLEGWLNTDMDWENRYWLNIVKRWPFRDGSVSHVFADNVIEHLPIQAGRLFLGRAHKALRPEGRLRLVTPDARRLAQIYLGDDPEPYLSAMRVGGHQAEHGVDLLRHAFSLWGHHSGYVYDEVSLTEELLGVGFTRVIPYALHESDDEVLRDLERRADFYEPQIVLEAIK